MSITLNTISKDYHSIVVDDGGGSITVDGTVAVSSVGGTVAVTKSGTWTLDANSGVDIGDVTINNGAGVAAVNIQDGGNSITVDGTIAATQSGTWNVNSVPAGYSVWQAAATSVTSTATQLDATPLTGRLNVEIQNLGSKDIFVGPSNAVTTSTGLKIHAGDSQEILLDDGAQIWAITASGSSDVRLAEYAN